MTAVTKLCFSRRAQRTAASKVHRSVGKKIATGRCGVELGPSFIPNADIARKVCYLRTHQSQNGQKRISTQPRMVESVSKRDDPPILARSFPCELRQGTLLR